MRAEGRSEHTFACYEPRNTLVCHTRNFDTEESALAAPLADRILEVIGDASALAILRELSRHERTQAAVVSELGMPQSVASRTVKTLRLVGLVAADSPRGVLRVRAPDATMQILQAANNLADELVLLEAAAQKALTLDTRRIAVKPAGAPVADRPVGR